MLDYFSCFSCRLLTFFNMIFLKIFFQEPYQSVKWFMTHSVAFHLGLHCLPEFPVYKSLNAIGCYLFECHIGILTLCLLVLSADNLCKKFGPRSGSTKCWAWSWSKLYDTPKAFLKDFFEKVDFERYQQTTKNRENYPGCKELLFNHNPNFLFFEPVHEIFNNVPPAKPQINLLIWAVWSEPLLVAWIWYDYKAADLTPFGIPKLQRRLHRLVWVYTCQNATSLEITCHGSFGIFSVKK